MLPLNKKGPTLFLSQPLVFVNTGRLCVAEVAFNDFTFGVVIARRFAGVRIAGCGLILLQLSS